MELKKINGFENAGLQDSGKIKPDLKGGPSFEETLGRLQNWNGLTNQPLPTNKSLEGVSQGGLPANNALAGNLPAVKFSNHAVERMQTRGISFTKPDLEKLNQAIDKANAKGSKDTLVLMDQAALIVSVKNKTVVTVMDKAALKENVFTNIDSTVVL